jgi:hypothetical protein
MTTKMQRKLILRRAAVLREEIRIHFATVHYWNAKVRKPSEDLIDPDPYNQLQGISDGLDRLLNTEAARAPRGTR